MRYTNRPSGIQQVIEFRGHPPHAGFRAPCGSRSGRPSATTTLIVEERELPFELTPERVRRLCAPHTGVGSDGVLLMRETDEPG